MQYPTPIAAPAGRAIQAAALSGMAAAACGLLVLAGWQFNVQLLMQLSPGLRPMHPLSAALSFLCGLALALRAGWWPLRQATTTTAIARAAAALAAALACIALAERSAGLPLHIDHLWFAPPAGIAPSVLHLGTAGEFAMLGLALLCLDVEWRHGFRPAQWLAWATMLLALFVLVDNIYGDNQPRQLAPTGTHFLHTPFLSLTLALGVLLARPGRGLVRALTGNRPSGTFARSMLPAVVAIPILAGWLGLKEEQDGIFSNEFGDALFTLVEVAALTAIMFWTSNRHLNLEQEGDSMQGRIARLSRITAVLSAINAAIVRVHNRQALYQEACRVAVKDGAFGMAWIAEIDPVTLDGRVAAWQGGRPGYTAKVGVTAAAGRPHSERPASIAVREMRPVICNDIETEAALQPLRHELREGGHRSVAVLPIVVDGKAVAVLALYASERGFFDEQEMKLLDDLAGDLGFALQYLGREERLNYLAYYDALTGLPNLSLFQDRLAQFLHGARPDAPLTAVILLNLNRFAQLNDAYGRHTGDALLRQIAQRLQAVLPESCSVARVGGDTFAIAAPQLRHAADSQILLLRPVLIALEAPFELGQHDVRLSLRAGIALGPSDGDGAETLYKHAETALKNAKGAAGGYVYYAPEMNVALAARLALEHELQLALDAHHFVLHYQPRVDLRSGRIVSAEALIRWQHPVRGLLGPGEFIALAEETGMIAAMGDWVIDKVCEQQALWRSQGVEIVPVAVNLSAAQFKGGGLIERIRRAVKRNGIEQHYLEFELTESMVMHNPEEATRHMAALKALGTQLSMDDFGTGYSSLAYLKRFPFDYVKIDRAFVTDVTTNSGDAAIATAIIAMAHSLKLKVVAEGVETEGQLQFLQRLRCDEIQGYYFSRPVPDGQFAAMLRDGKRLPAAVADGQVAGGQAAERLPA